MRPTDEQAAVRDAAILRHRAERKSIREIARLVRLDPRNVSRRLRMMREAYEHIRNRRPA